MKLYTEMDVGEQHEFLAMRVAFDNISLEDLLRRIKFLAKRIHSSPEKVQKDIYADAKVLLDK